MGFVVELRLQSEYIVVIEIGVVWEVVNRYQCFFCINFGIVINLKGLVIFFGKVRE